MWKGRGWREMDGIVVLIRKRTEVRPAEEKGDQKYGRDRLWRSDEGAEGREWRSAMEGASETMTARLLRLPRMFDFMTTVGRMDEMT